MTVAERLGHWNVDASWSLFLDRDGVINTRLVDDYVKTWDDFVFLDGVRQFLVEAENRFGRIFVVTNQQGIGKGLYTEQAFLEITRRMVETIMASGGRVDRVYWCPHLASDGCDCRKPAIGNALLAQREFPEVDFAKSVMVGDSASDMAFGRVVGMKTVAVGPECGEADLTVDSLEHFGRLLGMTDRLREQGVVT